MSSSLLPPGSSALERRLAQACSGISDLNVPLRDLWNPWKCPAKFLPYLAWAFSVDRWDEQWSEEEKRTAVSESFRLHQLKGTPAAIRHVTEKMGYTMSLLEWWQVDDPAGTFRLEIDVNEVGITQKMLDELNRLIDNTRPVSRHPAQLNMAVKITGLPLWERRYIAATLSVFIRKVMRPKTTCFITASFFTMETLIMGNQS